MTATDHEKIQGLLAEGWRLLAAGEPREAALVFGRVALVESRHPDALRGLASARAAHATGRAGVYSKCRAVQLCSGPDSFRTGRAVLQDRPAIVPVREVERAPEPVDAPEPIEVRVPIAFVRSRAILHPEPPEASAL